MGRWRGSPRTWGSSIRTLWQGAAAWGAVGLAWGAGRPRCLLTPRGGSVGPREPSPARPEGWDRRYRLPRARRDIVGDGGQGRPPPSAPPTTSPHEPWGSPREGRASASPAAPPNFIAAINNHGGVARTGPRRSPSPKDRSTGQRAWGRAFTSLGRGKGTLFPQRPLTLRASSKGVPVVTGSLPEGLFPRGLRTDRIHVLDEGKPLPSRPAQQGQGLQERMRGGDRRSTPRL